MPRSGVAPLYEGLGHGLNGRRLNLARIIHASLGLERGSFSLVRLALLYYTSRSSLYRKAVMTSLNMSLTCVVL